MNYQYRISFARRISDDCGAGIGIGIVRLDLSDRGAAEEKGTGVATVATFDAGFLMRNLLPSATLLDTEDPSENPFSALCDDTSPKGFSAGFSIANLGPRVTFIDVDQSDPLPATLRIGIAYSPVRTTQVGFLTTVDLEQRFHEGSTVDFFHAGGEVTMYKILALRCGYCRNTNNPDFSYWSWGAGLRMRFLRFNISRYTQSLLPSWHFDGTFSLEFK